MDILFASDRETVLVLSTGGTIVSSNGADGAVPDQAAARDILSYTEQRIRENGFNAHIVFAFDTAGKDSSDMSPEDWTHILSMIKAASKGGVKKVLIIHGTDTMAFTSSFLALTAPRDMAVVLTGSQRTSDAPDFDGIDNINFALETLFAKANGVYVAFNRNIFDGAFVHKENCAALCAYVTTCADSDRAAFHSALDITGVNADTFDYAENNLSVVYVHPALNNIDLRKITVLSGYGCGNMQQRLMRKIIERSAGADQKTIIIASSSCACGRKSPGDYGGVGISSLASEKFAVFNQKNYSQEFIIVLSYLALLTAPDDPARVLELYLEKF